ncbi:ABC transporter ATP-binding protein [Caulobacter endophyticus]|uniref:Sugar ABC transporter ATP-binding protein n=1 Tax=Caulobacter endophyticus TaxID=2172652 RepID=A0A2T9JZM2_9CAUL|nr:ABC transporter ATP-binding protein [Caulobacter endophyticus]PVM89165.1 sugar ABC transporter ATP-binding protein [Caulobacter endophyticus]
MAFVRASGLSIRFPVYAVDHRSLKKHLVGAAVGGRVMASRSGPPIISALQNISLSLSDGDRLGLIGHNGSGKTTLLRALAGAYAPDEGRLEVLGKVASLLDLSLGIDPSATGLENIRLRAMIAGLTPSQIDERLDDIAEFSGLGPYLAMPLKTYSAGMQARLAFSVATSVSADIVLMDEWISVGDAAFREASHKRLTGMVDAARILVIASHDVSTIRSYCNKVVRMEAGRASPVVDIGKLDELMAA